MCVVIYRCKVEPVWTNCINILFFPPLKDVMLLLVWVLLIVETHLTLMSLYKTILSKSPSITLAFYFNFIIQFGPSFRFIWVPHHHSSTAELHSSTEVFDLLCLGLLPHSSTCVSYFQQTLFQRYWGLFRCNFTTPSCVTKLFLKGRGFLTCLTF